MEREGRVVVIVKPEVRRSEVPGQFYAQILALSLGAYGATREDALDNLIVMFGGAVERRRGTGRLVPWLERSGLRWSWESEYDNELPVINASRKPLGRVSALHERPMAAAA